MLYIIQEAQSKLIESQVNPYVNGVSKPKIDHLCSRCNSHVPLLPWLLLLPETSLLFISKCICRYFQYVFSNMIRRLWFPLQLRRSAL